MLKAHNPKSRCGNLSNTYTKPPKFSVRSMIFSTVSCLQSDNAVSTSNMGHIYSWFLPMSWVLDLSICCLLVFSYVYMFGWLYRATCSFVPDIYFNVWYITCYPKWEEALEFTYKVIGEVLVLGLLVVVYKIPYSSCMWTRQSVFPSYYCLSGTMCVPVIVQYITKSLLLLST